MNNIFGNNKFSIRICGGSHSANMCVEIFGCPSGIQLSEQDFEVDINRRKPTSKYCTPRKEEDKVIIESGVFDGITSGKRISLVIKNENIKPKDYTKYINVPRPSQIDFVENVNRYNGNKLVDDTILSTGSGEFSGRTTVMLVAAGVIAKKILKQKFPNFKIQSAAYPKNTSITSAKYDLEQAYKNGDSLGGTVFCKIEGITKCVGDPYFDSVESVISHAMFSIPGLKGIEFGAGFEFAMMLGSYANDRYGPNGMPVTNHNGGIIGGLTTGMPIEFRVVFKPTASIKRPQFTWDFKNGYMTNLVCDGRHDVCYMLRCPVIVEAVACIALCTLI